MPSPFRLFVAVLLIAPGCAPTSPDEADTPPTTVTRVETFTVERLSTLRDPKEAEFLQDLRSAAKSACGSAAEVLSSSPTGNPVYTDEGIYQTYTVQAACRS